ncbi:hypothetical protein G8S21_04920 [Clostridium botulinum C]|uniref:hypothetical protein n=1 Tax=Clostridium botulinum TaxID=1491 RepID=UPI001E349182|nr:hypothetical protein [Clostridium botulinum]MCD3245291.1 hypothetical protein [Clostridium botulinum C]MCD3261670.1 hypothetical protein [Clostridium botulinum C]
MENKNFNENVVSFLKQEENMLRNKINKCLEGNNFSMYKNLIQAYEKVVELIKKYDWKLMYSEYKTEDDNGSVNQEVTVWEQNGDKDIRNRKVWTVVDNNVPTINLPQSAKVTTHISKQENYCILSYVGDIMTLCKSGKACIALKIKENTIVDNIINIIEKYVEKDKHVSIYVDGKSEVEFKLSYYLRNKGYNIRRVHTVIIED